MLLNNFTFILAPLAGGALAALGSNSYIKTQNKKKTYKKAKLIGKTPIFFVINTDKMYTDR